MSKQMGKGAWSGGFKREMGGDNPGAVLGVV
jgi:hypothetical protein